jgi:glycosyltransferase involved in cell wall biosynthesis
MPPLFTIAIPTFNRAHLIAESLSSALAQKYPAIEIIVSDNASTDETCSVVSKLADSRVRYVRHCENMGPENNFLYCFESATGEYFSWLQDDDLIFPDFAERAVKDLERMNAGCYLATCVHASHPNFLLNGALYSPPISQGWWNGASSRVPFELILPLSLLVSVGIPPVAAFRRSALESCVDSFLPSDHTLYAERILLARLAKYSSLIIAPHIAGVFRAHDSQYSQLRLANSAESNRQFHSSAKVLDALGGNAFSIAVFEDYLQTVPEAYIDQWLILSQSWDKQISLCCKTRDSLHKERDRRDRVGNRNSRWRKFKRCAAPTVEAVMPPIVLNGLRHAVRRVHG